MAQVDVPVPTDVPGIDDVAVEGHLETAVHDVAHVDRDTAGRVTGGIRNVLRIEEVFGLAGEVLDATVEHAVQEFEVETDVEGLGSLPGQVFITLVAEDEGVLAGLLVVGVGVLVGPGIEGTEVVVTLLTVADLEFQHVEPAAVAEEFLVADEPGAAHAPEVAPLVTRSETRRSVATEGTAEEVPAGVVILGTGQETLRHVGVGEGGGTGARRAVAIAEFTHDRVEQVVFLTPEALALAVVLFVTGQDVEVVVAGTEVGLVFSQVLLVDGEHAVVLDVSQTVDRSAAAEDRAELGVAGVVAGQVEVGGQGQSAQRGEDGAGLADEHVGIVVGDIILVVADGVAHHGRTDEVRVVGVIDDTAVDGLDRTVGVADVQRVDRTHVVGHVEHVARGTPGTVGTVGAGVGMAEAHGGGHLEPLLHLVVGVDTAGVTFVLGVADDTAVIHETAARIVVEALAGTADGKVVLLTERVVEDFVVPVIRRIVVFAVAVAEGGVGVQTQVRTDELFACGIAEYTVTQTAARAEQLLVRESIGLRSGVRGLAVADQVLVVQQLIIGFIVLARVGDHIVVGDQSAVGAEAGVELDLRVAGTLLRGDQDDTVCTAVTVDGRCGSILQYGHRLDVVRVDVFDGAFERRAVNDDKRARAGAHGADTTDADRGAAARRVTGSGNDLDTRRSTCQGVCHVRGDLLLDFIALDHGCGTGKRTLRRCTVGHHDGLLQEFLARSECGVDHSFSFDGDFEILVADKTEDKHAVARGGELEVTVQISGGAGHRSFQAHRSERDDFSCACISHRTFHLDVLGEKADRTNKQKACQNKSDLFHLEKFCWLIRLIFLVRFQFLSVFC